MCAAFAAWSVGACALELYRSLWLVAADPWAADAPSTWRLSSSQVSRLEPLAEAVRARLPAETPVTVSSVLRPGEAFFECLWVAYLLPELRVRCDGSTTAASQETFRVALGASGPAEDCRPVLRAGVGSLCAYGSTIGLVAADLPP